MDTSVLSELLGLLGTPASVGVEQPGLAHFSLDASRSGKPASGQLIGGGGWSAVWWGLVTCLVALITLAMARQHRRRISRLRTLAATPLVVLLVVMIVATARGTWFSAAPAGTSATVAVANAASRSTPTAGGPQTTGAALFTRLVAFEAQIASTQAELGSAPSGQGAALLRQERRSLAVALETTLQQEYDFFAAVAHDPAQAAALVQAAATKPAKVRNAVTYDIQAVQAQLAQQAAIAEVSQNSATVGAIPAAASATVPSPTQSSPLMWPMSGVITQGFGASQIAIEPAVTLAGITYLHFHTGVDIASTLGTPVQAAANGVVALAGAEIDGFGHLVGYGNYVVIAHGGDMITLYGHLERVLVHPDQSVHEGDPIGLEGSTGNSTGPHVHFELRIHGTPANPASFVAPR